jgi:hypothetical protein
MRGQMKTGTTMLDNIKEYFRNAGTFLFGSDNVVTDLDEIDNWGDFHGENQEEIDDMARIMKAETSLGLAKQKRNKFAKGLENKGSNPQIRQTNEQLRTVKNEELEDQKTR